MFLKPVMGSYPYPRQAQLSFRGDNTSRNPNTPKLKLSVIVPVYNKEQYLDKALGSLCAQNMDDIEFICINDGSQDDSLRVMREYAERDTRFKIIDQQNMGTGCARNNGLKVARGEYIAFLDPDDWFEKDSLRPLYEKAHETSCDLLVFDTKHIDTSGNVVKRTSIAERLKRVFTLDKDTIFAWRDIKSRVFGGLYFASWNKLYKNSFIKKHDIHFARSSFAEDSPFVLGAVINAESIAYSDDAPYSYLVHEQTASRSVTDRNFCMFQAHDSIKKVLKKSNLFEELQDEYNTYIMRRLHSDINMVESKCKFSERCRTRLSPELFKLYQEQRYKAGMLMGILSLLRPKK